MTKEQILKAHKAEAQRNITVARKELARLADERQDALDRNDREDLKAIGKQAREANKTILLSKKAIKEINAELKAA